METCLKCLLKVPVELNLLINLLHRNNLSRLWGPHNLVAISATSCSVTAAFLNMNSGPAPEQAPKLARPAGPQIRHPKSQAWQPPSFQNRKTRWNGTAHLPRAPTISTHRDTRPGARDLPQKLGSKTKRQLVADAAFHPGPEQKLSFSPVLTWFYPCIFWLYFSSLRFSRVSSHYHLALGLLDAIFCVDHLWPRT